MKTVPNVTFTLKADGLTPSTTASLLRLTLAQQPAPSPANPQGGFTFEIMRSRNRIADVIDKLKDGAPLKLEDADYANAVQCVRDMRWGTNHPDLLKFAEQFGL